MTLRMISAEQNDAYSFHNPEGKTKYPMDTVLAPLYAVQQSLLYPKKNKSSSRTWKENFLDKNILVNFWQWPFLSEVKGWYPGS